MSADASRLQYLEIYHHITQHLIGIAKLNMTPEQLEQIAKYDRELRVLWCNRLIDTTPNITDDDLTGMFNIPADVVEECRDARLPEGLRLHKGVIEFQCRSCDKWREWYGEIEDFELGHHHNVCGGSPRCCP